MRGQSPVHTLGTAKLSRPRPQVAPLMQYQGRSEAWGFVTNTCPQDVDEGSAHRTAVSSSTGRPQGDLSCAQPFHTSVHCSATRHPRSPWRVKGVTPRRLVGLWGTWVFLGTALGRSTPSLCIGCAELSAVHRDTGLSTGAAHRTSGQKTRSDLRKARCPRFPQALLLRPLRCSWELAWKWGLCTTRPRAARHLPPRLDPEPHRLSVPCVRLVSGKSADDEGQQGEPATAGGGFR